MTSDNQFGFKRGLSTSHAIYTVRRAVEFYTARSSTVNLCAIDISKAFDRMNHHGLFLKLMQRKVPVNLLCVIENWFNTCMTCVRWCSTFSDTYCLLRGIRQGGVLSPYLFALYINDIIRGVEEQNVGCTIGFAPICIILYADDILLLAPSVNALQLLLHTCEVELRKLDLYINSAKSVCIRIGRRFCNSCQNLVTTDGHLLIWADSIRYLGVYILAARSFQCSFDVAKRKFYSAFNAIRKDRTLCHRRGHTHR